MHRDLQVGLVRREGGEQGSPGGCPQGRRGERDVPPPCAPAMPCVPQQHHPRTPHLPALPPRVRRPCAPPAPHTHPRLPSLHCTGSRTLGKTILLHHFSPRTRFERSTGTLRAAPGRSVPHRRPRALPAPQERTPRWGGHGSARLGPARPGPGRTGHIAPGGRRDPSGRPLRRRRCRGEPDPIGCGSAGLPRRPALPGPARPGAARPGTSCM